MDGVSFTVDQGQVVGLVGESGCGKSVTSLALMGLLPRKGVRIGGRAEFDGRGPADPERAEAARHARQPARDDLQDPLSSLNPVVPIGIQVTEILQRHRGLKGEKARKEAASLLDRVGIPTDAASSRSIRTSSPAVCASAR
ncbi:ABC transporter ATP-binding protein [Streptomyces californicus]